MCCGKGLARPLVRRMLLLLNSPGNLLYPPPPPAPSTPSCCQMFSEQLLQQLLFYACVGLRFPLGPCFALYQQYIGPYLSIYISKRIDISFCLMALLFSSPAFFPFVLECFPPSSQYLVRAEQHAQHSYLPSLL